MYLFFHACYARSSASVRMELSNIQLCPGLLRKKQLTSENLILLLQENNLLLYSKHFNLCFFFLNQQHNHKAGWISTLTASQVYTHRKDKFVSSSRISQAGGSKHVGSSWILCTLYTQKCPPPLPLNESFQYNNITLQNYHFDIKIAQY